MQRSQWMDVYQGTLVQASNDLHGLIIPDDSGLREGGVGLADYSCASEDGRVRVIFRELERHLIELIQQADIVYGCVAWLTSEPVLEALARVGTQIVVQKEDFLRPDLVKRNDWPKRLRALYMRLRSPVNRYQINGRAAMMSYCGDPSIEAIRCVGNHKATKAPAFPRSHHKFVIFGRLGADDECNTTVHPYAVWTGSFNFTKNAGHSFENAVVLTDPAIVRAYENEWSQILALSEPLDWQSPWVAPEWRIGS